MSDKKDTNPIMTPEWFEALVSQPAQPSKIQCDNPPERADHTPLGPPAATNPHHLKELVVGIPTPDGGVFRVKPEVLAKELTRATGVTVSESAARGLLEVVETVARPTVESTAPPPSVDPGLLEGIKNCLEDAISALDEAEREVDSARLEVEGALCNLENIMEDLRL